MGSSHRLDATFAALADPTRRAILDLLAVSERSVKELTASFPMTQQAVSQHLSELHATKLFDESLLDEILEIDFNKAYTAALELCRREGLFAGPSSGLVFEGAREYLRRTTPSGGVGVMIFAVSVFKYVSSMVRHVPALAGL